VRRGVRFGNVRHGLIWFDQRWFADCWLAARWLAERRLGEIPPRFKLDVLNPDVGHDAGAWFAARCREPQFQLPQADRHRLGAATVVVGRGRVAVGKPCQPGPEIGE
jgi:hypothetical protein